MITDNKTRHPGGVMLGERNLHSRLLKILPYIGINYKVTTRRLRNECYGS